MRRIAFCTLLGILLLCGVATGSAVGTASHSDSDDGNVTMYRAHDSTDLESAADVRSGIENGTIENVSELVVNETLVVEIESDRLAAELEAENASPTDAFFGSSEVGATDRDLTLSGTPSAPGAAGIEVPLGSENTTVHRNGNVTYVLVDSGSVTSEHRSLSDDFYSYSLRVETESVTRNVNEPEVRFHRSEVEVSYLDDGEPLPAERIRRHLDVNIGTTDDFEVRLELEDGETRTPAIEPDEGYGEEGTFSFDLADVDHGTAYTLEFRRDGRPVRTMTGSVLEPHARLEVQDANATANGSHRTVSKAITVAVELSHGGEIRVTDPSGDSTLEVEHVDPGEKRNLTLPLYNVSPSANESVHVRLERESPAVDASYPNGSPAAVIHENGSVTHRTPGFEASTAAIVGDPSASESSTSDDGSADEPPAEDGIPGFTAPLAVIAVLVFVRRLGHRP
ncbi:hypothetical protein [Natrinema salinisoli]|uniref:hypothetical protein n=1 Tax=Natrinema salinisoli TaxID=2878535 RepID=UPI001CEFBC63|nr:hypothetical protein [Natrinema salinisoli]